MWTYLGDVCSTQNPSESVILLLETNIVGWALSDGKTGVELGWVMQKHGPHPQPQYEIMCTGQDSNLLLACSRAGLHCWASGLYTTTSNFQNVLLKRISIWHLSEFPLHPTSVPVRVAASICAGAVLEVFLSTWKAVIEDRKDDLHKSFVNHPHIFSRFEEISNAAQQNNYGRDAVTAAFFAAQHEEGATFGITDLSCPTSTRLGSSNVAYVYPAAGGHVQQYGQVTSFFEYSTEVFCPAPGALVIGSDTEVLLNIVATLCQSDNIDWTTLIVAPRHIFATAHRLLRDTLRTTTPTRIQYKSFATLKDISTMLESGAALPPVVLTSLELVQAHNPFSNLRPRSRRLVLLGWPHTGDVLLRSNVCLEGTFTLALAAQAELNTRSMLPSRSTLNPWIKRLANLFSLAPERLADAGLLRQLLSSRLLCIGTTHVSQFPQVSISCDLLVAPELSEAEKRRAAGLKEPARSRSILFGALYGPAGPFPWIPQQQNTSETVFSHFQQSSPAKAARADAFARKSYGADEHRDSCPICFDPKPTTVTLCGHWFCGECLMPALETVPACPLCKSPTNPHGDVVSIGRPVVSPDRSIFINFLGDLLQKAPGKTVVACSHGELHEKLARELRSRGVENVLPWTGNARQVTKHYETYCREGLRCCLLVDPAALSPLWMKLPALPPTGHIFVLAPLLDLKRPSCCQIREISHVFRGVNGESAPLTFVCRDRNHLPLLPVPKCCRAGGDCLDVLLRMS